MTPSWKIYRGGKNGEYIAATKYAEDAAALVALIPDGVVKFDHKMVAWTEGAETFSAGESYDQAAAIMRERRSDYIKKSVDRSNERWTKTIAKHRLK